MKRWLPGQSYKRAPAGCIAIAVSQIMAYHGYPDDFACNDLPIIRKKVIYDSLCVLHNDMSYNTERDYIEIPHWRDGFKGDIVSIDVVSNADFDEQHPTYSSLNDVILLLSASLYPYIMSGYKDTYEWEPDEYLRYSEPLMRRGSNEDLYFHPINKTLSEVTSSDLILVNSALRVFEKQPDVAQEHELTVTIRMSDGRVFSPTVMKMFE